MIFAKLIIAAAGGIATAVTAFAAKGLTLPLVVGARGAAFAAIAAIRAAIPLLLAGVFSATGAAVAGVVVALASLALITWDLIFNDGALLKRFEDWLLGIGWINAIDTWDREVLTPGFTNAWNNAIGLFRKYFIGPFFTAWNATRDFFEDDFVKFFTQTIPARFKSGWERDIRVFRKYFISPFFTAWNATRDFFGGVLR